MLVKAATGKYQIYGICWHKDGKMCFFICTMPIREDKDGQWNMIITKYSN